MKTKDAGRHTWIDRRWQQKAKETIAALRRQDRDRVLVAACPGAGKTKLAGDLIHQDLADDIIQMAVIVVHSRYLKRQWQKALKKYVGLLAVADIDNGTLEERQKHGMALYDPERPVMLLTYQQVASFPDLFAGLAARYKAFAVFDEIHHAADEADFGTAITRAFEDAVMKLSLSGTPFTTSGATLAFCTSRREARDNGTVVNVTDTDVDYSYGEALGATGAPDDPEVVRPVSFIKWNGMAKWEYTNLRTKAITERIYDGTRQTDPLGPLLDPTTESLQKMLAAAVTDLDAIRQHHRNAGMLITAKDIDHADDIAGLLRDQGIDDIVIVVHDTPGAQTRIETFDTGAQRVLIAVKMISEGVDIARLRVGVYASNVLTRMFFSQFIGRFVRWDPSLGAGQFAHVFIPEHVTLIEYAREIERMIAEAVIPIGDGGPGPGPTELIVTGKVGDGAFNGAIQHGIDYAALEVAAVQRWAETAGVPWSRMDLALLIKLYRTARPHGDAGGTADAPTGRTQESNWSAINEKLVGRIVAIANQRGVKLQYDHVQAWANRAVGIAKKDKLTSPSVLETRAAHLRQLLMRVVEGKIPDDLL